ncbi:MAG: DNA repair exonuclease [Lachnospiraceae bacterium]|jgi:DNA repair exonuclease SbcCD nuclease subunit|nr:DNA repair exonuclease [Lachnospiraceae bacterium]
MKFIHMADVHLGIQPDKGKPWSKDREQEIKDTFVKVIDDAERKQVDLLLIAGDLFHMPPSEGMLRDVDYILSRLTATKTIIIAGNHDYMKPDSPMANYRFSSKTICLSAEKINNVYMKDINTCVTGFSYNNKENTEDILNHIKPAKQGAFNILLAHGGDAKHLPFNKKNLKESNFDYVALGHIHKPEVIKENQVINCGSLEPIDHTDTGARGYIYGEVVDGIVKTQFVPVAKRAYMNLLINIKPDHSPAMILDLVDRQIRNIGEQNIYRILVKGHNHNHDVFDFSSLVAKYNIYEVVTEESRDEYDLNQLYQENQDNLIGKFINQLSDNYYNDEVCRKAIHYGLDVLLKTGDK